MSSGTWPYILNLGNSIIGVAVLAMPFCFKQCGIILGIVLLLFCTWLTLVSCQLLMKAAVVSRKRSYEFLAYYTFGAPGKFVIEIGMIGLQLGTLIAQIVVIGDLGPAIVSKVLGLENTPNLRMILIVFLCLCVGLPLGLLKDLRSVSRASTLAICFYTVFVFYVMLLSIPNLWTGNWYPKVAFWRPEGLFQTLPIFSLSFGCQTQLFLLYDSLPEPTLKSINSVISSAVNLCAVAYLLVGFFGYIAFYEEDVGGDIITLFPSTFAADMMKLFFVVSIAVTFPLIIFPCRASLYTLLFPQKQKAYEDLQEEHHMPELHFKFITVAIVTGSMIIGILVPNVEFILGMNGATMGTLICYIFPALFFVRVMANKAEGKHIAQLVMGLGITILLVSTFATLYTQDKGHTHPVPVKLEETVVKDDLLLLGKPPQAPIVDTKNEKRVEPPVPDAPLETLEKKEVKEEKKNEDLPKKDGLDEAKVPDKDEVGKEEEPREKKEVNPDDEESEKKKENSEVEGKEEKKEVVAKEEHLKEREKKIEENEQKQQVLLEKLVEQQEEQKQLINEQKQLLQELKEHKDKDHNEKEGDVQGVPQVQDQGIQQPVQGVQMQVQAAQQPIQGAQQPVQGAQQPIQGAQQPVQGAQQPIQGAQQPVQGAQQPIQGGAQQPLQGAQQPLQGAQQSLQGAQQPVQQLVGGIQQQVQGVQQPAQGIQMQVQGVQQQVQGVQQPLQGVQQPVQGVQQPLQGVQQPLQGVQQPVQGVLQPVQGIQKNQFLNQGMQQQPVLQQAMAQQPVINNDQQVQKQMGNLPKQDIQQPIQGKQVLHKDQQLVNNQQLGQQNLNVNQQNLAQKPRKTLNQVVKQQAGGYVQGQEMNVDKAADNVNNAKNIAGVKQGVAADIGGLNRPKRELSEVDDVLKEVEDIGGHIHKKDVLNKDFADRVVPMNQGSHRR